jgi:hypothetical protein
VRNVTKGAASCADLTHNHEGCRSMVKALTKVRALSLFTDREQFLTSKGTF